MPRPLSRMTGPAGHPLPPLAATTSPPHEDVAAALWHGVDGGSLLRVLTLPWSNHVHLKSGPDRILVVNVKNVLGERVGRGAHDGVRVGPGGDLTPGNTGDVDDARRGALQERKHQQGVAHPPRDANNFLQLWGNRPTRYENAMDITKL